MRLLFPIILGLTALSTIIAKYCPNQVPRVSWGRVTPSKLVDRIRYISNVAIYHTPFREECYKAEDCNKLIRKFYEFEVRYYSHIDTLYNFFWAFDELMHEGAAWTSTSIARDLQNSDSLHIGIIGNPSETFQPSEKMVENLFSWLECQRRNNKLQATFIVWLKSKEDMKQIGRYKYKNPTIFKRFKVGQPILDHVVPVVEA